MVKDKSENKIEEQAPIEEKEIAKMPKVTMDALTHDEEFPSVSENAIEAVKAVEEKKKAENQQNEPVKLKKDGTPAKKRGRKPKSEKEKVNGFRDPNKKSGSEESEPDISSADAAIVVSGILENMQVGMISKDFQYNELERISNQTAWAKTFDHYGGVNLTPPQALVLSHASIILARVGSSKETQSKLDLGRAWFKVKWNKFKNKRKEKKNAQSNTRSDDVGKNNVGSEESKEPEKSAK